MLTRSRARETSMTYSPASMHVVDLESDEILVPPSMTPATDILSLASARLPTQSIRSLTDIERTLSSACASDPSPYAHGAILRLPDGTALRYYTQ